MPAAANIVLNDGTDDRTFTPVAVSAEKSVYACRDSDTSAGSPIMILGYNGATPARVTHKVSIRLNIPKEYTDTNTGLSLIKSTARASLDVVLPDDWTTAERTAFWNLFQAGIANAVVSGYVDDLTPVW
jgi:hypothetical protein